ncbi:SDR family NAD(P)-dependent oxidoreductase [Streptomyces chrestomyceticus]|uniref:SDR family NAD(P)-dependent oxidoreductase n=1 Tax=Streptomyces chrestomyceticus TaxID=68185 RepID=UPI0033E82BDB
MTKTLVVVGAGPGVGMGVARAFGRRGFRVGLIARTKEKLDALVGELTGLGVTAAAFPADIRDRESLTAALSAARSALGPIGVLEFGPSPTGPITHAAQTTVADVTAQYELHVLGAVAAAQHVLPEMRRQGDGALLLTIGVSATVPAPFLANVGMAMAGLRNWALALHAELAPAGLYVGTVTIATAVVPGGEADPDLIGERYYRMYEERDRAEEVIGDPAAFRALVDSGQGPSAVDR